MFAPSVLTGMRCLFCSRTASAYYDFFITTTTPGARIDYGQVQQTASPRFTPADTEHPVACVMDGPRTSIDGWCYYSADPSTSFTLARPIYLLCAYSFDSINTLSSYCSGRLHSCRIWDGNGNMQRDLLPAERDGVVGLWDAQNRVFYPGQSKDGSVLTAGPERTSGICEILEAKAVAVGSGLDISGRLARIGEEGATVTLEWGATEALGESETIAAFAADDVERAFAGSLRNVAGQAVYWRLVATAASDASRRLPASRCTMRAAAVAAADPIRSSRRAARAVTAW